MILGLIQLGGLGVLTISVALFTWLGRSVSIRHRLIMQDLFAHTPRQDIYRLVRSVIVFTLATEAVGAILLTLHWSRELPLPKAIYFRVFHAISAFCNAGFALLPDSMVRYGGSWLLNLTICSLIIIGGIGFPVLYDLQSHYLDRKVKKIRLSIWCSSCSCSAIRTSMRAGADENQHPAVPVRDGLGLRHGRPFDGHHLFSDDMG